MRLVELRRPGPWPGRRSPGGPRNAPSRWRSTPNVFDDVSGAGRATARGSQGHREADQLRLPSVPVLATRTFHGHLPYLPYVVLRLEPRAAARGWRPGIPTTSSLSGLTRCLMAEVCRGGGRCGEAVGGAVASRPAWPGRRGCPTGNRGWRSRWLAQSPRSLRGRLAPVCKAAAPVPAGVKAAAPPRRGRWAPTPAAWPPRWARCRARPAQARRRGQREVLDAARRPGRPARSSTRAGRAPRPPSRAARRSAGPGRSAGALTVEVTAQHVTGLPAPPDDQVAVGRPGSRPRARR